MSTKPNTSRWTLTKYLEEIFIPSKLSAGITERSAKHYRLVVQRFLQFAGDDLKCRDVTATQFDQFEQWLIKERRYKAKVARSIVVNVRIVLRHWDPERFPTEQGHTMRGSPAFAERDIEGTLEQICVENYLPERTAISSPSTVRQYARCLRLFSVFLGHTATPTDLTDRVVGKFLRWLVNVEGVKPVTANGYVKQVKALWTWLAKKRIVDQFPTVQKLKEPNPTPVAWTRDEFLTLLAACHEQVGFVGPVLANLFWVAFYHVLWDTGERTGAMLSLRRDWLDTKSGHLTVPGEFRKGRVQSMVYKLKPATILALRLIAKPSRELIFDLGDRKEPTGYFYQQHRLLITSSGLPFEKHKSGPQKARRTFASFIEAAGGNATKALKHRDRRVTEDSYLDPRITEVESENQKLFPLDDSKAT